jgi:hypothetical protein
MILAAGTFRLECACIVEKGGVFASITPSVSPR